MRALWQSFLDPEQHRPYIRELGELLHGSTPEVEFDIVGIRPPDRYLHALTEVRCGIAALRNALYAERNGYDVVVIGHFQEPLLHEIRASVAVPVVGLGEASLTAADGSLGLIAIDEVFVPWHTEQVRRHGIAHRVVGIRALDMAPDSFMEAMCDAPARTRLLEKLEAAASPLVAAGAETIVPAGALTPVALRTLEDPHIAGAPVLNGVAIAARAALAAEPARAPAAPAAAVDEFLQETGGALTEPVR